MIINKKLVSLLLILIFLLAILASAENEEERPEVETEQRGQILPEAFYYTMEIVDNNTIITSWNFTLKNIGTSVYCVGGCCNSLR